MSTAGYHFTAYPDGTVRCRLGHDVTPDDTTNHLHPELDRRPNNGGPAAMNPTPPARRMTAADMLHAATQTALPVDVGRQDLVVMPLTPESLEALADALERLHTRATLGDVPVEGSHELYALADAAQLARDAARYGYPAAALEKVAADARAVPAARLTDPATSHGAAAAKHGEPSHRNHLGRLLLAFRMWEQTCDPHLGTGLTSEEAAERAGIPLTSEYAKRCSELRAGGYLEPEVDEEGREVTREGGAGRPRIVWHLTAKGRRAAAELVDLEE